MRLTLARVNKELAQNDIDALLAKGRRVLLLLAQRSGPTGSTGRCRSSGSTNLSLEEWVARFHELRRKNQ